MTEVLTECLSEAQELWLLDRLNPTADLQQVLELGAIEIVPFRAVRRKAAARVPKRRKVDGLFMYTAEPTPKVDRCQGGIYHFIEDPREAIEILNEWRKDAAWVAVDSETSAAWRMLPDPYWQPGEGESEKDRPLVRSYLDTTHADPKKWKPFGSDPFTSTMFMVQMSVEDGRTVILDMRPMQADAAFNSFFPDFLTTCRFIAHDGLFDVSFFREKFGVFTNLCFDTAIGRRLIYAGAEKGSEATLAKIYLEYEGLKLDKAWQASFLSMHPESFIPRAARQYAATDTIRLKSASRKIYQELLNLGLDQIWERIERPLMYWVAKARYDGMLIAPEGLSEFQEVLREELEAAQKRISRALPGVNPNAPAQLVEWFVQRGAQLPETKKGGVSTDEEALKKVIASPRSTPEMKEAAEAILEYRPVSKAESTYVRPLLLDHRNPITQKIHPYWRQCPADTGRFSCSDPNGQNIPIRNEKYAVIRDAFVAPEGYKVITIDYSQFEVRGLAELSGEQKMIVVFEQAYEVNQKLRYYCRENGLVFREMAGLKDAHDAFVKCLADGKQAKARKYEAAAQVYLTLVAQHPYVQELLEKLVELDFHRQTAAKLFHDGDVSKVTKEERGLAKTVTFGVPYGAGASTVAVQAKISVEEADKLLSNYFEEFSAVARWLAETQNLVVSQGYTETPAGRKRFYRVKTAQEVYQQLCLMQNDPERAAKWRDWCRAWRTNDPWTMAQKWVSADLKGYKRAATNHPIQGLNADVTKAATNLVCPRLYALNPECTLRMWIHDEIVGVAPDAYAEEHALIQEAGMIEAAKLYVKRCPIEVSVAIDQKWSK